VLRAVIDTSSLVSYVLTRGALMRRVAAYWRAGTFILLSSPATQAELAGVLARPRIQRLAVVPLEQLAQGLKQFSEHVPGNLHLPGVCRDPKDIKFLECALEGDAHYLVSSDRDLLDLRYCHNLAIMNPGQFLLALELYDMSTYEITRRFAHDVLAGILDTIPLEPSTAARIIEILSRSPAGSTLA
jgi:putative PIN family toxin of toxin-antitoxin system